MSEVTGLQWANAEPYKNIENNPRVRDDVIIWCGVCHDEAVVISNDGKQGLCWDHYSYWCEQQPPEGWDD